MLWAFITLHIGQYEMCKQTQTRGKTLTVCPWNVLMGRSCPSLQTWIHMSVLQEANVLLLCQSTSSAGAVGGRRTDRKICKYWKTLQPCKNITTFGVLYLSGRETAVWLLLYERPKWLLSAGTHKHVQLQNISLIHLLTSYMQHGFELGIVLVGLPCLLLHWG